MAELMWVLIRQDGGGNQYRVGRYATRAEAERVADALGRGTGDGRGTAEGRGPGDGRVYVIERVLAPRAAPA